MKTPCTSVNTLLSSVVFAGQQRLFETFLCQCATCTEPPCSDCIIPKSSPHSKCNLHLWQRHGRECKPGDFCHGCLRYADADPSYTAKAVKLHRDRVRQRRNRATELPQTLSTQSGSENEFTPVKQHDPDQIMWSDTEVHDCSAGTVTVLFTLSPE